MWPLGLGAARLAGFLRPRRRSWPGERLGRVWELRETDLGAYSRRRGDRRSGVAEAGGGRRWELCSGELVARPEQQAKGGATGDPRAGRSNTRWRCKRLEGGARRGHHWRWQWRLGVWAMRAAGSLTPFIGARALWRGSRPSTVWVMQGGGEAQQPMAAQGRRDIGTVTPRPAVWGRVAARERAGRVGLTQMGPTARGPTGTGRSRRAGQGEPRRRAWHGALSRPGCQPIST
jgi:hypothetical protein